MDMSATIDVVFCLRTADDTALHVTCRPIDPDEQINITDYGKIEYRTSAARSIHNCNTRVFHQRHNRPGGHQQSITLERATLV